MSRSQRKVLTMGRPRSGSRDILNQSGYSTEVYDPFFAQHDELLKQRYQFVCASEVVEHFHNPAFEFLRLRGLLKRGGVLALMTALNDEKMISLHGTTGKIQLTWCFTSSITFVWISKRFLFTQPSSAANESLFYVTVRTRRGIKGP